MGSGIHHRCDERSRIRSGSHRGQDQIGIRRDVLGAHPGMLPRLHVVRRALTNRTTTAGSGRCAESEAAAIVT